MWSAVDGLLYTFGWIDKWQPAEQLNRNDTAEFRTATKEAYRCTTTAPHISGDITVTPTRWKERQGRWQAPASPESLAPWSMWWYHTDTVAGGMPKSWQTENDNTNDDVISHYASAFLVKSCYSSQLLFFPRLKRVKIGVRSLWPLYFTHISVCTRE